MCGGRKFDRWARYGPGRPSSPTCAPPGGRKFERKAEFDENFGRESATEGVGIAG